MVRATTTVTVTEPVPPLSASLSTDKVSALVNEYITWTITISGGKAPYTVNLKNFSTGQLYASTQSSTTTVTGRISFSSTGTYSIYAEVNDSSGQSTTTNRVSLTIQSATQPLSASLSANKTSTTTDSPVTFTVTISGGQAYYRVQIINSTTNTIISDQYWSSSPATVSVYLSQTGTFSFYAKVTDANNSTVTTNSVSVTVSQPSQPLSVSLSANRTSITAGESVSFTITASGGKPNYIAQLRDANTGTVIASTTSFSPSTTITVRFDTAGTYRIYARVTDSVYTTADSNTVTIYVSSAVQQLMASLSVDRTSVPAGTSFTLTVSISGGKTPYNIQLYISGGPFSNALLASGSTSSSTWQYQYMQLYKATYTFYAKVTDANNSTVTTNSVSVTVY
jgi:hypothetical protein